MFIKKISVKNYRPFEAARACEIDDLNIPDGSDAGSGLTCFVGENGCGKTALLNAFALPALEYKANDFELSDLNDPDQDSQVIITSNKPFKVSKMMKGEFMAEGLSFRGGVRKRGNKKYLSSIVACDQKFVPHGASAPAQDSPDLRAAVNNPFSGKRFDDNDILYLDKNRLFQIRSGNYNRTRFDRLMEDFNYQHIKAGAPDKLDDSAQKQIDQSNVENEFLSEAIDRFEKICPRKVKLSLLDHRRPFSGAFFTAPTNGEQRITLDRLGSGYEMIFAVLWSFYLARQSGKDLIILMDEPELHLHPKLQERFVDLLLEFAQTAQIILASHSPTLVKNLMGNNSVKIKIIGNDQGVVGVENRVLPYPSSNETNFLAFDLPTPEYHIELYEELLCRSPDTKIKEFDKNFLVGQHKLPTNQPWRGRPNEVSLPTHVRNQIHHPSDLGDPSEGSIRSSIEGMRNILK